MPLWLKRELAALDGRLAPPLPRLLFTEHHQAHAASAFFANPSHLVDEFLRSCGSAG